MRELESARDSFGNRALSCPGDTGIECVSQRRPNSFRAGILAHALTPAIRQRPVSAQILGCDGITCPELVMQRLPDQSVPYGDDSLLRIVRPGRRLRMSGQGKP